MTESALRFDCEGARLVGVLSTPSRPSEIAWINLVGGPQYRAGSHRQFVHIARTLADKGIAALRFDARGMGDSDGDQRSFEDFAADVGAAIDAVQAALPSVRRVVLCGLCGGATSALLYWRARRDARVVGMVLINPWVRSDATLARTHIKHYYLQRLMQGAFWRKLLSGRVAKSVLTDLWRTLALAAKSTSRRQDHTADVAGALGARMAAAWADFGKDVLLVLSENDFTAKEFLEAAALDKTWQSCLQSSATTQLTLHDADHTYSQPGMREKVESAIVAWIASLPAEPPTQPRSVAQGRAKNPLRAPRSRPEES